MTTTETIKAISNLPKVKTVTTFMNVDSDLSYTCIEYVDKFKNHYDILVSIKHLHLLLQGPISVSPIRDFLYVKIGKLYLHKLIKPTAQGQCVHHCSYSEGEWFTLDNREQSLTVMDTGDHSKLHRTTLIKPRKTRKDSKK